ncbi:hypothetical protein SSP24_72320 [Streptomyces spinoverrucosus]|uniref:Phage tail protein n=2 Tax=Streptomyces spinoverrucosus TaxID=284043 RepID=A0A4Y3VRU6_9ACTN|nr:hypothetical protein SSP24_72320 [Streptomyces spinoverrucosus]GHB96059.1 hypothetical protein GCM10010397_80920 [Streptomyces spinoverrucosus]
MTDSTRLGLSMRFGVVLDGIDLGGWSSCKGLGVGFDSEELEVGGNYEYNVILPKRVKYTPITLQRAMTADGSAQVQAWLRRIVADWYSSDTADDFHGSTAQISLLDARNNAQAPVATWSLRNVYPKGWKGPDLDATSSHVAIETLELVHQGFL